MKKKLIIFSVLLFICFFFFFSLFQNDRLIKYDKKISLMKTNINLYENQEQQIIFISICNKKERSSIFKGTGKTINSALNDANKKVKKFIKENKYDAQWVKIDLVTSKKNIKYDDLSKEIYFSRHEFFRYGLAFDSDFNLALLETELNGAKIYEYDNGGIDLKYLNLYLKKAGRTNETISELPTDYIIFGTNSVFCDENNNVYSL